LLPCDDLHMCFVIIPA